VRLKVKGGRIFILGQKGEIGKHLGERRQRKKVETTPAALVLRKGEINVRNQGGVMDIGVKTMKAIAY